MNEKEFLIHWLGDSTPEKIKGYDVADAFRKAGIGAGALSAVDWVEEVGEKQTYQVRRGAE